MEYMTNSDEETRKLAEKLAKTLAGGEIFVLTGDLGAGKTTFIQGLAKGLGIKNNLTSPTFVLMKRYKTKNPNLYLVHIDCYRVESSEALKDLGLDEIFEDKRNIVVIEWGEKIEGVLPNYFKKICFESIGGDRRKIETNVKLKIKN